MGIDPSARKLAAVVSLLDDFEIVKRSMPVDITDRCAVSYRWMRQIVRDSPRPVAVFIESPFAGKFRGSGMVLAKIHGAMLAGASVAGADYVAPVPPSAWKSKVLGNGNAGKPAIARHLRKYWRELFEEADGDQDVLDAGGVNRYGREILRMRKLIPRQGVTIRRGRKR